jgi:class 3 adenylate cyclase/poly(3-hydroxybutyrate) depolymerase
MSLESTEQRRLAAIMFTDIVGYSALTQRNESLALSLLSEHNRIIRATLVPHHGTEIKTVGDAFLVEFGSALDAVRCAIAIQAALQAHNTSDGAEAIHVRIGIHLGDVVYREGDVFGDGVNIAARIQSLADAGEICVSEDVARQVQNKLDVPMVNLGQRTLKNIQLPVDVYKLQLRKATPALAISGAENVAKRWVQPTGIAVAVTLAIVLTAYAAWAFIDRGQRAAFVAQTLPQIEKLARESKFSQAFKLAREVQSAGGAGAVSEEVWKSMSREVSVNSQPEKAVVSFRQFGSQDDWIELGATPLRKARVPNGPLHWRARLEKYRPANFITQAPGTDLKFELRGEDAPDADMVLVPAGDMQLWSLGDVVIQPKVALGAFLIDRTEVTNQEFARFVKAGGYEREDYWKHPFKDGSTVLSFAAAMGRFRDTTGRPGPASWRLGSYPDGEETLPVRGLSWYEAAAYAVFAGKELPTIYHWYRADTAGDLLLLPGLVLPDSNFESHEQGPRAATSMSAMSAYGAVDMAGNVREWVSNATYNDAHITVGGAWTEPSYLYLSPERRSAFDRSAENGVRCIKRVGKIEADAVANQPLPLRIKIDAASRKPVSDQLYEVFTRFFERQPVPLDPQVESSDESAPHWIKQKISFAAGYGGERLTAWLFLPKVSKPPYQVMIQMGGAAIWVARSSANQRDMSGWIPAESLIRSGRAVLLPLWKGSYERADGFNPRFSSQAVFREHVIQWTKELRQSVDYLSTRADIDASKIGYLGLSFGATFAPQFIALEPRLKTGIILLAGMRMTFHAHLGELPPEIDIATYAPRVKMPMLMLNGQHDAINPYETSQLPLFRLLGTPPELKRHTVFPGGHSVSGWTDELIREELDWLDQRFGPPVLASTKEAPRQ